MKFVHFIYSYHDSRSSLIFFRFFVNRLGCSNRAKFLSDRGVGACKRFMATAREMSLLKNIIPSPAAIESHYSIRVQLPRRQHGHTRRINDFVTYKFQ